MLKPRSALASLLVHPGVDNAEGRRTVRLGEIADTRIQHVGVYSGCAARVADAVAPILGGPLPESAIRAALVGDHRVLRIAPDQYWVLGGESGLGAKLRAAIATDAGSVTSLDGARTRLLIEGSGAQSVLRRLVPIDLDPTVFPVGGFAQTGIHHVGGLLLRTGDERFEYFALRTFAASIWEVLVDAARSFGYEIASERIT